MKRKFETREEMQEAVDSYFDDPPMRSLVTRDGDTVEFAFLSITGLALHLGFTTRQSLYDYGLHGMFMDIVQEARLRIEHEREFELMHGNTRGATFALKQFGWTDKLDFNDTTNHEDGLRELAE